jgi:hypothetical protein
MSDSDWHWSASSIAPHRLLIWLEPWAEEFEVPPGSTADLHFIGGLPGGHPVENVSEAEGIVFWASAGQTVRVSIDGILQESGSTSVPVPEADHLSTRQFLDIVLGAEPAARPQPGHTALQLLAILLCWGVLSAAFLYAGFGAVANLFGREGNDYHLAGFALVLAIWLAASGMAALALRRRK